jgi:hypothetical protein
MNPYKDKDIRKFIQSIPKEVVEVQMKKQAEESEREYQEFISSLKIGKCFLCGNSMDSVDKTDPCFHWFTYPTGIKKKHFEKYLNKPIGFFRLDCYFRWLANTEMPIGNINDLKEEISRTSYLETTIKYKDIEWAFSIGHTDKEGHVNGKIGNVPHYHIQMKVEDRIFLKFNDFHIPFSDADLFTLEMQDKAGDLVSYEPYLGHGISILENEENLDIIDEAMIIAEDESTAPFRRQTFIQAEKGKTLSGAIIRQAVEESNKTKEPIGRILQRLLSDEKITTIISAGEGVPDMTKRSGKK